MRIVQAAHHETSEVEKKMMFFKSTVELVNEKFGGIDSIEEQIKIAKLKEQSVGNLMHKLDTCIVSSPNNSARTSITIFFCFIYRVQPRATCNVSSASRYSQIQ